jgi:tripartite-type tricarboxylate transporter receptor subunit TctC
MNNTNLSSLTRCAVVLIAASLCSPAWAQQDYPTKPIKLVVGFGAGGAADIIARLLGQKMSEALGQPVVIENRPGAGSNIAFDFVAKAEPDGYTLALATPGYVTNPNLYGKTPYRLDDFAPIAQVASTPLVFMVPATSPAKSVQEFIKVAQTTTQHYNYASAGIGSSTHLASELFVAMAKVKLTHVPYKGGPAAFSDLMNGQVNMIISSMPESLSYIKSGKVKPLAVTGATRAPALPDLPTMAESGMSDFVITTWYGILAPAKTPKEVIGKLHSAIQKSLSARDTAERFAALGFDIVNSSPEGFTTFTRAEFNRWAQVIKVSGIKAE